MPVQRPVRRTFQRGGFDPRRTRAGQGEGQGRHVYSIDPEACRLARLFCKARQTAKANGTGDTLRQLARPWKRKMRAKHVVLSTELSWIGCITQGATSCYEADRWLQRQVQSTGSLFIVRITRIHAREFTVRFVFAVIG